LTGISLFIIIIDLGVVWLVAAPNLQDHLREMLGLGVVGVGAMFGLPAAIYIISASLVGKVADK
jgi:hypothetical protein